MQHWTARRRIRRRRAALAGDLLAGARARGHGDQHRRGVRTSRRCSPEPNSPHSGRYAQTQRSTALPDRHFDARPARTHRGVHSTTLAHRMPSMLWPTVSLPSVDPALPPMATAPSAVHHLLLVNSMLNLDEAASLIDSHIDGPPSSRVLQLLEQHDQWHSIRAALIRMADHLAEHESPIDYQRRRRLDYTTLLPDTIWAQICRDTATPGPWAVRARIARCFLFEKLSGQPAALLRWCRHRRRFAPRSPTSPHISRRSWPTPSTNMPASSSPITASNGNLQSGTHQRTCSSGSTSPVPTPMQWTSPNCTVVIGEVGIGLGCGRNPLGHQPRCGAVPA